MPTEAVDITNTQHAGPAPLLQGTGGPVHLLARLLPVGFRLGDVKKQATTD